MKKILSVIGISLSLVGCANIQRNMQDQQNAINNLNAAAKLPPFSCSDKKQCDKAWKKTKLYVMHNADMKIQTSDDTIIQTYGAIEYGYISLVATREPLSGENEIITIDGRCKGLSRNGIPISTTTDCGNRLASIFRGFVPYLEQ